MLNRVKLFRSAFLLVAGSGIVFWLISFWLPLNEFLAIVSNPKFDKYQLVLKSFIALFVSYALTNLVVAGVVAANQFSRRVRFYLTLIPGIVLIALPFLLTLVLSFQLPKLNYFQVTQATFASLRFSRTDTFWIAVVLLLLAGLANIYAALIVRGTGEVEKLSKGLKKRYVTYTSILAVLLSALVAGSVFASGVRSLDRAACQNYKSRQLPVVDNEVPAYLSDLMVYGQSAGSKGLQDAFIAFSTLSRQYFAALDTENGTIALGQLETAVAAQRTILADLCSEFASE